MLKACKKAKKKEEKETEQIRGEIKRNEQMANKNEDALSAMDTTVDPFWQSRGNENLPHAVLSVNATGKTKCEFNYTELY